MPPTANDAMTAAPIISCDVEDWPQSSWNRSLPVTPRSARNIRRLLQIMEETGIRSTMFVLGKFAETFPDVVREIHAAGHEIASHGYGHEEIYTLSPAQFREDVRRSKEHLEQLIGAPVVGYRGPDFSIVRRTLWALDVLAELGIQYDSTIFPTGHHRYGIPNWPLMPRRVLLRNGLSIVEFPLAAWPWLGKNWPVAGGGYHRLLPGIAIRALARRVLAKGPFVYYCHPYECDPGELKEIDVKIPLFRRLHQGLGRRYFEGRFRAFVAAFGGRPFGDIVRGRTWPDYDLAVEQAKSYQPVALAN